MYDCIIIGAGQSGLASARFAQRQNLNYLVLERGNEAGESWCKRCPDLQLFTSRDLSALTDLPLEGDASGLPTAKEMADYFAKYRKDFAISCQFGVNVIEILPSMPFSGFSIVCENQKKFKARSIVLANGSNQEPAIIDEIQNGLSENVRITDSQSYWRKMPEKNDRVLIIGDGGSGRQIANDLANRGFNVTLSGKGRNMVPNTVFGKNLFHWLKSFKILEFDRKSFVSKIIKSRNPVPRRETLGNNKLTKVGVKIVEKSISASDHAVWFEDEYSANFEYIVFAVGYEETAQKMLPENTTTPISFCEGRGSLPLPGVFVTGRCWLHNRASELIMGAENDAEKTMNLVRIWLDNLKIKN